MNEAKAERPRAIWLEAESSAELDVALKAARQWFAIEQFSAVSSLADAIESLRQRPARCAFFAEPRRGLWQPSHVEHLHQVSPLVQLAGVYGSWCEGWQRTGHPLPGLHGVYWHQLPQRLPWLAGGNACLRTVGLAEQLALDDEDAQKCQQYPNQSVLLSAGFREQQALTHVLDEIQWRGIADGAWSQDHPPAAMIWDGDVRCAADCSRLDQIRSRFPQAPLLARTLAPRVEDWQQLELRTSDILSRPHLLRDLYGWLRRRVCDAVV